MHLDPLALVAVGGARVVGPDDLLRLRIDLDNLAAALLDHDVPVGQHVDVVDAAPLHLPRDLTVLFDNRQLAVALQGDAMSGVGRTGRQDNQGNNRHQAGESTHHQKLHQFEAPSIVANAIGS